MKKLLPVIVGMVIGALAMYYLSPKAVETDNADVARSISKKKIKCPKDTITVARAKQICRNWGTHNPNVLTDELTDSISRKRGGKKRMRSVYWSLKTIKEYLTYAEAKSDTLGYDMTGIRIYLANYGKNTNPIKNKKNTMFIVPTGSKNINKASSLSFALPPSDDDIPAPPLNAGTGGEGGY